MKPQFLSDKKIAVLIAGRLDTFEDVYESFQKYVIDYFQPDIFFSGYQNKKGFEYCEKKLIELWNPKKYVLQEYTEKVRKEIHPNDEIFNSRKRPETKPNTWLSGIYNVKIANNLKKQFEIENNFKYDICIKVRTDCIWHSYITENEIQLAEVDQNILIPTAWDFKEVHPMGTSDVIAVSNSDSMDKYSSLIDYVDEYFENGHTFHPESLVGIHINHLKLNRISISTGNDPFSNIPNQSGWVVVDPNPNRRQL